MGRRGCHFSHGQNPVRSSSFRGLSLFRNHTETLATQARLDALGKTKVWKGGVGGLIPRARAFPLLFHESPASRTSVFAILNIVFLPSTAFVSKFWRIPLLRSSQIPHYTNPASQDHPSRSCKTFSATADLHHVVWLNSLCVYILCF